MNNFSSTNKIYIYISQVTAWNISFVFLKSQRTLNINCNNPCQITKKLLHFLFFSPNKVPSSYTSIPIILQPFLSDFMVYKIYLIEK